MVSLIFLHGNSANSHEWSRVVKHLSRVPGIRCHNWDLFGHDGKDFDQEPTLSSQASFLNKRIEEEIKGPYVLIGHSLGGHVAMQMAIQKLPQGLITIGSPPISKTKMDVEPWKLNPDVADVFPLLLKADNFTKEEAIKFVSCQGFSGDDLDVFVPIAMKVNGKGRLVAKQCLEPDDIIADEYQFIRSIEIPYLCIQGEIDGGVNTDYLYTLNKDIRIVKGAGHAAPWTHADDVTTYIVEFMISVKAFIRC
jgi:pimeloyl-ACP methyl ester carboxylesterase